MSDYSNVNHNIRIGNSLNKSNITNFQKVTKNQKGYNIQSTTDNQTLINQNPLNKTLPTQSFNEILKSKAQDITFSKHATERLDKRNITLSSSEIDRIKNGLDKASQKGVREALVLMDNKVFVASVVNRTIITATTNEQLQDNIFTNIDGAVIV